MEEALTPEQFQARLVDLYQRIIQPVIEWVNNAMKELVKSLRPFIRRMQRLGYLPYPKCRRRPKQRSTRRMRVALKRRGLWTKSVWA